MNIFLLYCTEILVVLVFIPGRTTADTSSTLQPSSTEGFSTTAGSVSNVNSATSNESPAAVSQFSSSPSFSPSPDPNPIKTTTKTTTKPTTTTTKTISHSDIFSIKECRLVLFVSAGLIIACAILLISTLFLAWRTCHLSRLLRTLSTNGDLISNSEYWMGTARSGKSKPETEAKETTVLMSDLSQTQEAMGNGTTNEDGGKVKEDGQKGEEKEAGDSANSEQQAAAAEDSSSSKPQEEADNSQSAKAAAASSSEGTEEPKDVL